MSVMAVAEPHDTDHATLCDAARVHTISREVQEALSALAVHPLDEARATQMLRLLGSPALDEARTALTRLRLVRDSAFDDENRAENDDGSAAASASGEDAGEGR